MRRGRSLSVAVTASFLLGGAVSAMVGGTASAVPAQARPAAVAGSFVAVAQHRLISGVALRAGHSTTRQVTGHAAVPTGATAVAGTLSVTSVTAGGGITAWGNGSAPGTTNLQFRAKQAVSDTALIPLSNTGAITLKDTQARGSVHVYFDVTGYVAGGNAASRSGIFHPLATASRVIDTRSGRNVRRGAIAGGHTVVGSPAGHGGIPGSGVGTLAVTVTAVSPTATGSLTAFAAGTPRPGAPVGYFGGGQGGSTFALVPVSRYGQLDLYVSSRGSVHVVVDVVGWFASGPPLDANAFQPTPPEREHAGSIAAGGTTSHRFSAAAGVPRLAGGSVLATIVATGARKSGRLIVWSADDAQPATIVLQFGARQTVTNQVMLPVGASHALKIRNVGSSAVTVAVDVHGYFASSTITPPAPSAARYLNDLTGDAASDNATMFAHGQTDGAQNTFALLDVGAQTVSPPLSVHSRGVALALSSANVHLTYGELVTDVERYIDGFVQSAGANTAVTIAVGTNNDGAWDPHGANYYAPTSRGADWAVDVIKKLRTAEAGAHSAVNVVGADDIEAAFASTEQQAEAWEVAYLTADTSLRLIYNGDANSCPVTFGATGKTCAFGWTESQYYHLAHNAGRVQALPQIFFPAEAIKWANINATGDGTGEGRLTFVGSLTEFARDRSTLSGPLGWAALHRSQESVVASLSLPRRVELASDGIIGAIGAIAG